MKTYPSNTALVSVPLQVAMAAITVLARSPCAVHAIIAPDFRELL